MGLDIDETCGTEEGEGAEREGTQRRFGAAGDDHLGPAIANVAIGFSDRDVATCAAIRVRGTNAAQAELNRDIAVSGAAENLERDRLVDRFWAAVNERNMLFFCIGNTSQRGSEANTNARLRISWRKREAAVFQSEFG